MGSEMCIRDRLVSNDMAGSFAPPYAIFALPRREWGATPRPMKLTSLVLIACAGLALAACKTTDNRVSINTEKKAAPSPAPVVLRPRSEPIFYNGKMYHLDFAPGAEGLFDMAVSGMSAKQEKDAVAVATSSLRYFACPDGKTGKLTAKPTYSADRWKMQARCA